MFILYTVVDPSPLREFHRFADPLTKLRDLYISVFPGGNVRSTILLTLSGAHGTTNSQRYPGDKPWNVVHIYISSLYPVLLSNAN